MKDLVVLVADKDIEFTMKGIFSRPQALSIRPIKPDIYVDSRRDPGCLTYGHEYLRSFVKIYSHALIIFDREGCGQEQRSREELEQAVETRLSQSGWEQRAAAIILDPELEIWVWNDSPHVATLLGWSGPPADLKIWLSQQGFWQTDQMKPTRPKEALEQVLFRDKLPRSSKLYEKLAKKVSFKLCHDKAFLKFKTTLQTWFPE